MNRRAVLLAATALIYAGAVMIGMSGQDWLGLATILALLLLYTVLMRPAAQWSGPGSDGALRLVLTVAALAALSGILWLVGRGLSQMVGSLPVWPGIALAGAGIALARGFWSAEKQAQMDALLDDALSQLQGGAALAPTTGAPRPAAEEDARWKRRSSVIAQVEPGLSLARARDLAAMLAPDLDRELYREAMLDLADLGGPGALRMQLALMARREVMPWWDDAFAPLSLLERALKLDEETAVLACDVADYRLSEPDADLVEATGLLDDLEARLIALPAESALLPRLQAIVEPVRAAASALAAKGDGHALATGLAVLEAPEGDDAFLAWLEAQPLTEAMQNLLALAERAAGGDGLAARALVLYGTSPVIVSWLSGVSVPAIAFLRIDNEAALNTLFIERAHALLAQKPHAAAQMPNPDEMQCRATRLGLPDMAHLAEHVEHLRLTCETGNQKNA